MYLHLKRNNFGQVGLSSETMTGAARFYQIANQAKISSMSWLKTLSEADFKAPSLPVK